MSYPNTFIIGAPKCGTTSLAEYLKAHSDVFLPNNKEPFYWGNSLGQSINLTEKEYLALYKNKKHEKIVLDGSTNYCWSRDAIPQIIEKVPNAKFIYMIRNPVDMIFSWHSEMLSENSAINFNIEKSWNAEIPTRKKGLLGKNSLDYKYVCSLGTHLKFINEHVEPNNLMVLVLDDLKLNPEKVYLDTLNFLNINDEGFRSFLKHNENKTRINNFASKLSARFTEPHNYKTAVIYIMVKNKLRIKGFGINNWLTNYFITRGKRINNSSKEFRHELIKEMKPEIRILESLLKRDFSLWN